MRVFLYVERFGVLLLRFLNANLSTYETSYKGFLYAYGFEILKDIDEVLSKYKNINNYIDDLVNELE